MLSRVADSVYWLSRYVERAESVARLIDVNYNLTLGENDTLGKQWAPLVYTTGDHEAYEKLYGDPTQENVLKFLTFDKKNPNSILSCVSNARENARTIREVIPQVVWEQLNKFYLLVRSAAQNSQTLEQPHEFCERVRLASHLLVGAAGATMSQGEAWHFARLGRMIERADKTSRIVDVQYFILLPNARDVGTALDVVRWSALLKSASALEMYRREHGKIVPERVADFLILDRLFPRAMHFCLINAQDSLQNITGSAPGTFRNRAEQRVGRLCSNMHYTSIADIIGQGLHQFIDDFQSQLIWIGESINDDFFVLDQPKTRMADSQTKGSSRTQTQTQS